MTKHIHIKKITNKAYNSKTIDDYAYCIMCVSLDGKNVLRAYASEGLSECPEDARFCRDLFDPCDFIETLNRILGDDPNYIIAVTEEVDE